MAGERGEPEPIFYSYAYPSPAGFADAKVEPAAASWNPTLKEFVLAYEAVRVAENGDDLLFEFAQSTYEAAARLADWDRKALEHRGAWPK